MLRALVLSAALSVAIGPSLGLVCAVWCQPQDSPMSSTCTHHDANPSQRMTTAGECCMASGEVAALWREDAHRGLASIDLQQSVAVPSSFSAHVLTSVTQNTASPIDSPPHPIALRI